MTSCFQNMELASQHDLPKFTQACLEFAAAHYKQIVHPQLLLLSANNLSSYLKKFSSKTKEKEGVEEKEGMEREQLSVIMQWATHVPPGQPGCGIRIDKLTLLLDQVFQLESSGHLLSSEVLDRIQAIDLAEYGLAWRDAKAKLCEWLMVSWRLKFKTLGTSSIDLQERVHKVKRLIDTHQKATVCSVFQPSNLSVFGLDNAATHNYMLLEYKDVINF